MRKRAAVRYKLTSCGRKDAEAGSAAAVAADEADAAVGTEEERNKDEPEERFGCAEDDAEEVEEEDKEDEEMDAFAAGAETKVH